MKNIIFVIAVVVCTMIANLVNASETLAGNSLTKFGKYELTPMSQSVVIDDVAYKTWELSYSDNPQKFQLFIIPGDNGTCCYNVRGADFEVRYTLSYDGFGAKYVLPEFRTISRKELLKRINLEQMQSQVVITTTPKTEAEYLGLIACFMPLLMN